MQIRFQNRLILEAKIEKKKNINIFILQASNYQKGIILLHVRFLEKIFFDFFM